MAEPTAADLIEAAARAAGYLVLGLDDYGHVRVVHPTTGRRVSLPTTAPNRRGIAETYRDILTSAGQPRTTRAAAAARDERHHRTIACLMDAPQPRPGCHLPNP